MEYTADMMVFLTNLVINRDTRVPVGWELLGLTGDKAFLFFLKAEVHVEAAHIVYKPV